MKKLPAGTYFGDHKRMFETGGLIISDIVTTVKETPWHYHENAYFTYIIDGVSMEVNQRGTYTCTPGMLLFHHCQEPHQNRKTGMANVLHVEITGEWFSQYAIKASQFNGNRVLQNPSTGLLIHKLYKELLVQDNASAICVHGLAVQLFSAMATHSKSFSRAQPRWVSLLKEYVYDNIDRPIHLEALSKELKMHPTYLCQAFPIYFSSTFGAYIRKVRIEKATWLLTSTKSLTDIAYKCGFADQSHFIRCFKEVHGLTPLLFKRNLSIRAMP